MGKAARRRLPRRSHGCWEPAADRPDPIELLEAQARTREQDLVPVRYGRMLSSPFAFFRGGPAIMANDLAGSPDTGLTVQTCGDAHLANFGLFASPERDLIFDVNDFDETLPGPWEWDVKRLAASVAVAARQNGFPRSRQHDVARQTVRGYREAMLGFARLATLDLWYLHLSSEQLIEVAEQLEKEFGVQAPKLSPRRLEKVFARARTRDSLTAYGKLAEPYRGNVRLASRPPLLVPLRELWPADDVRAAAAELGFTVDSYRASLRSDRQALLDQFEIVDLARKVVGVGSVGTRCFVVLLRGKGPDDMLVLQIKQAEPSVLEAHLGDHGARNHGQRVVGGQCLLQALPDTFLGWAEAPDGRDYYVRQLWDMKGAIDPTKLTHGGLGVYGALCGWTLARAHGRGGDEVAIAGYLGRGEVFDEAIAEFAVSYADVNDRDHRALAAAVESGRVQAVSGV
ncbi:DUF2252 domain-containing protein [Kribbella amoyensis]|uniref:DUF2252 domain-containing protein n=1 Tax=Kribbella amoyensis TaxID=996641 RepID=UPI001EE19D0D|nr:DUF2252 domain-containing protein [Kribbella amoyensis]